MICLDTNVLVRFLVQDDPVQSGIAVQVFEHRLTEAEPGCVPLLVLAEVCWVLQRSYGVSEPRIREIVATLLEVSSIVFENTSIVASALDRPDVGLADALIHAVANNGGCEVTLTFDRRFARLDGVELLG